MKRTIAIPVLLALASGLLSAQTQQTQPVAPPQSAAQRIVENSKKAKLKRTDPPAAPASSQPQPPPAPQLPPNLANSPPVKPTVTMQGGLLTIDAPNSTLSDVLSGVRRATGATLEGAAPNDRVAVKLGPGKPEQVIAALLRGTPYDYVILGSPGQANVVTRILLSSPERGGEANQRQAASRPAPPPESADDADTQEPENPPEPQMMSPRQPAAMEQQQMQEQQQQQPPPQDQQQQQQPQPQQQQQEQPKTPEQLFRELQQMNQQRPPQQQEQPQQ